MAMTQLRAQELVVGCMAATAVVSATSTMAKGDVPGMRLVVGLAFTGMGLAAAAMFAPDLAGSASVLILTTTVFVYGAPLMDAVTSLTGAATPAGTVRTTNPEGTLNV